MSFGDNAEQCTYIIMCRAREVTDGDQQPLENTPSGISVSRALVYRWHRRFSEDSSAPLS